MATNLPPTQVDGAHIERVLVNLLENALKYSSPADRVELDVSEEDETLFVRIRDHGPGVGDSDRERIFEPFERGAGASAAAGSGSLSPAGSPRQTAAGFGWRKRAGSGATFVLALPAAADRPVALA